MFLLFLLLVLWLTPPASDIVAAVALPASGLPAEVLGMKINSSEFADFHLLAEWKLQVN